MDTYVTNVLFNNVDEAKLSNIIDAVRNIRLMIKAISSIDLNLIKKVQRKLEACRNQENNPDSQAYKRKHQLDQDEDEMGNSAKMMRYDEN